MRTLEELYALPDDDETEITQDEMDLIISSMSPEELNEFMWEIGEED